MRGHFAPLYWALRDYKSAGQIGLEPTWRDHLQALKPVFAEVKRVMTPTGNCFVNYGDTVAQARRPDPTRNGRNRHYADEERPDIPANTVDPAKHKLGLGWRLRFMLNDDLGFISRSDIVWWKRGQMPLSLKDRVTPKHEYVFHLVKNRRYFFDLDAIRKPFEDATIERSTQTNIMDQQGGPKDYGANGVNPSGSTLRAKRNLAAKLARGGSNTANFNIRVHDAKNGRLDAKWGGLAAATGEEVGAYVERPLVARQEKTLGMDGVPGHPSVRLPPERGEPGGPDEDGQFSELGANPGDVWVVEADEDCMDVWDVSAEPLAMAHFATYPRELVRRLVSCGCPERVCLSCGKPWRREYKRELEVLRGNDYAAWGSTKGGGDEDSSTTTKGYRNVGAWRVTKGALVATCKHEEWRAGVVLDPFAGSGTTGLAAAELGRDFCLVELNPRYVEIARRRLGELLNPLPSFNELGS